MTLLRVTGLMGVCLALTPAHAATPKLDKETCAQFKTEQIKFIQSGILADLQRGPEWGKANLSADRLREVEHYIQLDEQIKFACREATLTPDLAKIEEIAKRLETNPNIDPFAPLPDPNAAAAPKSGAAAGADAQPNLTKKKSKALQQIEGAEPEKPKAAAPAKPKPKPQAAKKPPVDDAYTGPPVIVDGGAKSAAQ